MAGQGSDDSRRAYEKSSSVGQQTRATYDTLMRQSRKLGDKAMRAVSGAGQGARQIIGQQFIGVPKDDKDIDELKKVIIHSHEMIAGAETVLPFLFTDSITLDRAKITITKRNFFFSADVTSIRIEDVLNVAVSVGPILGSMTVSSRVMNSVDHYDIGRFWRKDAIRIKKIIQGYQLARQNGVETDHLSCEELAKTLFEIDPDTYD